MIGAMTALQPLPPGNPARSVERTGPVTARVIEHDLGQSFEGFTRRWHPHTGAEQAQWKALAQAVGRARGGPTPEAMGALRGTLWQTRSWIMGSDARAATPAVRQAFDRLRSSAMEVRPSHYPSRTTMVRPATWAIANFREVAAGVYGGGQPDEAGLAWLRAHGIVHEVDLRGSDIGNAWDEPSREGIECLHLPVEDMHCPSMTQVLQFKQWIETPGHRPAFIHCKGGIGRTSALLACWLITTGLSADQALARVRVDDEPLAQEGDIRAFERQWQAR